MIYFLYSKQLRISSERKEKIESLMKDMKTGEWNETFNFDEEETDLTTVYENTDNISMMDSLSVAGKILSTSVL